MISFYKFSQDITIIVIIQTSCSGPGKKQNCLQIAFATHLNLPRKNRQTTSPGSKHRLTTPLSPFNVPVLNIP